MQAKAKPDEKPSKTCLPITPPILRKIRELWDMRPSRDVKGCHDAMLFHSFFWSEKIIVPEQDVFNARTHLSWGNVAIDNPENPQAIRVYLRHSKTDQFGRGTEVIMGRPGDLLCPVAVVVAFMRARGTSPGPFFIFHDGAALTKGKFVQITRQALQDFGLTVEQSAGHSFQIGAATVATQAGLESGCIMMLRRWNSAAFLRYIWTPKMVLAAATACFSGCLPPA